MKKGWLEKLPKNSFVLICILCGLAIIDGILFPEPHAYGYLSALFFACVCAVMTVVFVLSKRSKGIVKSSLTGLLAVIAVLLIVYIISRIAFS